MRTDSRALTLVSLAPPRRPLALVQSGAALRAPQLQPLSAQPVCKVNGMVGDCKPLGYFDPLGFSKDASPETMAKCAAALRRRPAASPEPGRRSLCGEPGGKEAACARVGSARRS